MWKTSDLPFALSPAPFTPIFNNRDPMLMFPSWVVVDAKGLAALQVVRGIDATYIVELLNKERGSWTKTF